MPELTPQDIHEAHQQAYKEFRAVTGQPLVASERKLWKDFGGVEQMAYARMAELLNGKLAKQKRRTTKWNTDSAIAQPAF